MTGLAGRTAIVTGAARGIGRAIAAQFLEAGARVVLADLPDTGAEATAAALGPDARAIACEVTDAASVAALFDVAEAALGPVDILVNNAGIAPATPFLDLTEAQFRRVVDVNLTGTFLCAQTAARRMVARVKAGGRAGSIVNLASVQAQIVAETHGAYAASKGGVVQLTKVAAVALAPWGIRVNAIGPGSIETDLLRDTLTPDLRRTVAARTPLGRLGLPEEIAQAALFLASDAASYVTGQTLYVDGGRLSLAFTMPEKENGEE